MAEKCVVCSKPIEFVFLEKVDGTFIKDSKGKKRAVCSSCQKSLDVAELRSRLK